MDHCVAGRYGEVVSNPEEADVAILRLETPFEWRDDLLEAHYHTGDLDFKGDERSRILRIMAKVPTIVDIYLDRPAVIPEIAEQSAALLADFGACDKAILDAIFGCFRPSATLPFELPSSMDAVQHRRSDVPRDSDNPLFPFGHGLTYGSYARGLFTP
jgi:beta-glucosidase